MKLVRRASDAGAWTRRLQQLEAEREVLRRREKEIRRALAAAGVEALPVQRTKPDAAATRDGSAAGAGAVAEAEGPRKPGDVDLFSWRERRQPPPSAESEGRRFRADNHFAAYLATAGFATRTLGPADPRVRRARILVAVLILLALAFVLWHLLPS